MTTLYARCHSSWSRAAIIPSGFSITLSVHLYLRPLLSLKFVPFQVPEQTLIIHLHKKNTDIPYYSLKLFNHLFFKQSILYYILYAPNNDLLVTISTAPAYTRLLVYPITLLLSVTAFIRKWYSAIFRSLYW